MFVKETGSNKIKLWTDEKVQIVWNTDEGRMTIKLESGHVIMASEFCISPSLDTVVKNA